MREAKELYGTWERAEKAHQQRRYDAAAALWEIYLDLNPDNVEARVNRVFALLNSSQPEEALAEARTAYAKKVHAKRPELGIAEMALLESLDNNGLVEELSKTAVAVSEGLPQLPYAWLHRGKLAFFDEEHEKAVEYLGKAIQRKPTFCLAWLILGESLMRLRRFPEALYAFGQALGTYENYPSPQQAKFDALISLGRAVLFLGRPDQGLALAEQAERMNINATEVQGLRARCKFSLDHPDAVSVTESALMNLGFQDDYLKAKLAGAYADVGRMDAARRLIGEVSPDPDDEGTRHERAGVLLQLGDAEAAIEELHTLEGKLQPHILWNSLASAYRIGNDLKRAEEFALKALNERRDVVTVGNLALLCNQLERFEEAELLFKEALELQPDNPSSLAHMGYCYSRLGKKTMAREVLQKASRSEAASQGIRSLSDELLGRLYQDEELEARYKREGTKPFVIKEVESYRQLIRDYKTSKFETECCRTAEQRLGWFEVEQRKKLTRLGEVKTPDVYGLKRAEDGQEVVCLGECKMKGSQLVSYHEVKALASRMELAAAIESNGRGRGIEGHFFTNTDYEEDAKEFARERGITMYQARITGNPQKSTEWRVSALEQVT